MILSSGRQKKYLFLELKRPEGKKSLKQHVSGEEREGGGLDGSESR